MPFVEYSRRATTEDSVSDKANSQILERARWIDTVYPFGFVPLTVILFV